ncbi:MAG: hypothetical protein QM692_19790 [Thermomicrobiales bacterium]
MDRSTFDLLAKGLVSTTPRRALLALLAAAPFGVLSLDDAEGKKKNKNDHKKKRKGRKRRFCLNGTNYRTKRKRRKRRLRRQGAVRGRCPNPGPDTCTPVCPPTGCGADDGCGGECGCTAGNVCANGACEACTVTCTGSPTACGAELAAALLIGGDIYVCPGLYEGNFSAGINGTAVYGAGSGDDPATNTIVDGANAARVFSVPQLTETTFSRLRIINGNAGNFSAGGAINVDTVLFGTTARDLTVDRCVFAGNKAGSGGAIATFSNLYLSNSQFTGNEATFNFGGVLNLSGQTFAEVSTITNCTFTDNSSASWGGVIYSANQTINVSASTFSQNTGLDGGAIAFDGSSSANELNLDSATSITNNTATDAGSPAGGILNNAPAVTNLNGATVANNTPTNCTGVTGC